MNCLQRAGIGTLFCVLLVLGFPGAAAAGPHRTLSAGTTTSETFGTFLEHVESVQFEDGKAYVHYLPESSGPSRVMVVHYSDLLADVWNQIDTRSPVPRWLVTAGFIIGIVLRVNTAVRRRRRRSGSESHKSAYEYARGMILGTDISMGVQSERPYARSQWKPKLKVPPGPP